MLEWSPDLDFEPSRLTKSLWRYIRKSQRIIAGITLPGLFQISHFPVDTFAFMTVIGLELWGLANFLIAGNLQFIYIAFLFLLDLVFAIARHLPQGHICENMNRLVVEDDPREQERLKAKVSRLRFVSAIFFVAIFAVALLKVFAFWGVVAEINGLTVAILVSYLIAATLHVSTTGYFLFGIATALSLWADMNKFRRSDAVTVMVREWRIWPFDANQELQEARADKHELKKFELKKIEEKRERSPLAVSSIKPVEQQPLKHYVLLTRGLLRDRQLDALVASQYSSSARAVVAREGIRHQLYILQSDPQVPGKAEGKGPGVQEHRDEASGVAG